MKDGDNWDGGYFPPSNNQEQQNKGAGSTALILRSSGFAIFLCALLSTVLSAGYVASSLGSDGYSGIDLPIIGVSALAFFSFMAVLHMVGVKVLPMLEGIKRQQAIMAWAVAAVLVTVVSYPTGLLFTAEPIAMAAQFRDGVEKALTQAADTVEASRSVEALIPSARGASDTAEGMVRRERQSGAISGRGGGTGITTDALSSIMLSARSAEKALINARAEAAPLVRRMNQLTAKIRRVADAPDMTWAEKKAEAKGYIVELGLIVEALRRVAPLAALQGLVDGLSKDWDSLGLEDPAATVIAGTFEPVATQFTIALDEMQEEVDEPIHRFVEKTGFSLLAERVPEILPIAVFVALLDGLPIMIVILVLVLTRRDDDDIAGGGSVLIDHDTRNRSRRHASQRSRRSNR